MTSETTNSGSSLTDLLSVIFAQASGISQAAIPSTSASDPASALLSLIRQARSRIDALSLISSNDSIDDLPTSSLRAVLLGSIYANVISTSRTKPGDFSARKELLKQSKDAYRSFLSQLISLGILDRSSSNEYVRSLFSQAETVVRSDKSPVPEAAAARRAAKIAAMKLERALVNALDTFRNAARAKSSSTGALRSTNTGLETNKSTSISSAVPDTAFDLLILPKRSGDDEDGDEEEEGKDDAFVGGSQQDENGVKIPTNLRSYLIMLCHLHALQSFSALDSTFTELTLLQSMPANAERESQARANQERQEIERRSQQGGDSDWRLDQRWGTSNDGPLMDKKGKPLRPFTILPGQGNSNRGAGNLGTAQGQLDERRRLQSQVFQQSHRLPTMTIDEYLEEEERRGNIIQGGGQASADKPTTKETLALRSEGYGVGTRDAEEAEEEQRQKANDWDDFAEANPKGIGNTMNRG